MNRNDSHSPHSPHSLAHSAGRMAGLTRPAPSSIRRAGGRVSAFAVGPMVSIKEPGECLDQTDTLRRLLEIPGLRLASSMEEANHD
jgi:hypothetical protein